MSDLDSLYRQIEQYEVIIKSHEDTATKQVEDIWSATQPDIDAAREIIRHQEALIAQTEADREARKRAVLSIASKVTAPTYCLLADAKHQLATIFAPILRLPTECIAEIMNHFSVDNPTVMLLLVCKRWNTIAKETPRLWSNIVLPDALYSRPHSHQFLRLKEAHICKSLEHLSLVLSLAKGAPLDIELAGSGASTLLQQCFMGHMMTRASDNNLDWRDEALRLLGADGRSRRWRSLYITSWSGTNYAAFTAINGPFDNLRSLSIQSRSGVSALAYEPLVAAIVQKAPRLSAVDTQDLSILQRVQGWKDQRFWRKIECFHSLVSCEDYSFLSQAARLKDLSLVYWHFNPQSEPVILPCLHTLRLLQSFPEAMGGFRLPALETLFLHDVRLISMGNPGSILVPSVTSIISTNCSDLRILQRFSAPILYHLHISFPDYVGSKNILKALQNTFAETFDGSQFMPKPISLHLELSVSESKLLSALSQLPQIEELKFMYPMSSKFWTALTPRGAGGRRKPKKYCPNLRIMIVETKRSCGTGHGSLRARTLELGIEMATAREQEGQALTHLLFSWDDGSKDEVLGSFRTLPIHPSLDASHILQHHFS